MISPRRCCVYEVVGTFLIFFLSICITDLTSEFFIGKTLRSILTAPC